MMTSRWIPFKTWSLSVIRFVAYVIWTIQWRVGVDFTYNKELKSLSSLYWLHVDTGQGTSYLISCWVEKYRHRYFSFSLALMVILVLWASPLIIMFCWRQRILWYKCTQPSTHSRALLGLSLLIVQCPPRCRQSPHITSCCRHLGHHHRRLAPWFSFTGLPIHLYLDAARLHHLSRQRLPILLLVCVLPLNLCWVEIYFASPVRTVCCRLGGSSR